MREFGIAALIIVVAASAAVAGGEGQVGGVSQKVYSSFHRKGGNRSYIYVQGHKKKDGTYVKGHRRSVADDNFNNNWSTKGNENPYTGKEGSRGTPPATR